MKKILLSIFSLSIIFFSILNFLDYSYDITEKIESNKTIIQIDKPKNLTTEQYINNLISIFNDSNEDIMYKFVDNTNNKSTYSYYITTNNPNFLNLDLEGNKFNTLIQHDYLSTKFKNLQQNRKILGSNFFYDVNIYNLKEVLNLNLNLESTQYYIENNNAEKTISILKDRGYSVDIINYENLSSKYVSLENLSLPAFLLFISIIFYTLSNKKEIICKKMLGYSKLNIILNYFFDNIKNMICILIFIELLNLSIVSIIYGRCFLNYFYYTYKKLILIIIYILIISILSSIFSALTVEINYLKGKTKNLDINLVTLGTKFVFCILLLINITSISIKIISIYSLNKINTQISSNLKNYVTLPINNSNISITDSNQLEFNSNLQKFYNETVNKFDGILIDTRKYRNINSTLSFQNKYITINENYLNINPIHDVNGNIINSDNLSKNNFNILVPENKNENEIKEIYSKQLNIDPNTINIIKYLNGEKINSFSPYVNLDNNGLIIDPIIFIYNSDILTNQMLNYISGGYYILKINNENPYNYIQPILSQYKLDSVILESPYIYNVFDKNIQNIKIDLIENTAKLIIYIIGLFVLIIYNSKIYFSTYSQEISYKKLNGYGFIQTYNIVFILQLSETIIFLLLRNHFSINFFTILIIEIIQLFIFYIYARIYQSKNILNVMKGEK